MFPHTLCGSFLCAAAETWLNMQRNNNMNESERMKRETTLISSILPSKIECSNAVSVYKYGFMGMLMNLMCLWQDDNRGPRR